IVGGPGYAIHYDSDAYPDPDEYRPVPFSDMAEALGDGKMKRTMLSWLNTGVFGRGRLACPGRFFASTERGARIEPHGFMTSYVSWRHWSKRETIVEFDCST
ncbi:hypothetical protein B0T25DRAFT_445487, partial [Lasiosphaeria hispida]